jgi:hypothetical protein
MQTTVESPRLPCYRYRGIMKIERKTARKTQPWRKPCFPRGGHQPSKGPASARQWPLAGRSSLALTPTAAAEEATTFLIANPRLEFSLNHRKHSYLQIPNRERMRVFQSLATSHSPLAAAFLIGSSAIRKSITCLFTARCKFLIGVETGESAFLVVIFLDHNVLCPRPANQHGPHRSIAHPHLIGVSRTSSRTRVISRMVS